MSNSQSQIRARFAPSPTGYPHIGGIWIVLMQWLFVRHQTGTLVVRIEDTDRQRYVEGAEEKIFEALKWYGLEYDEGPDVGGDFGPYRQSERLPLYQKHAEILLQSENAYYCFCTAEELATMRKEQEANHEPPHYDGRCRDLPAQEAKERAVKEAHVVRIKFPRTGTTIFKDLIRGEVAFRNDLIDDQVLMKSDGWPTYHLAVVVDDHFMQISHVFRGEEWLSSTPKHLVLYDMFGWKPPLFAHLPLILGPDRSKLSKRHGSTEALLFREEGYLPDALINFLALLGWNPKTTQEIFTRQELVSHFDLSGMNKSGAIFDRQKLLWFNAHYLKELSLSDLTNQALPFLQKAGLLRQENGRWFTSDDTTIERPQLERIIEVNRDRAKTLVDFVDLSDFLLNSPEVDPALLPWKQSTTEITKSRLERIIGVLENLPGEQLEAAVLEEEMKKVIEKENLGTGETLWPMRVALSGRKESLGPFAIASVLGKAETIRRLQKAADLLASV